METGKILERFWEDPGETWALNVGCRRLGKRTDCRIVDNGLSQGGCGWGEDDSELLA